MEKISKLILILLLSSFVFAKDTIYLSYFNIGLNTQDNSCFVMSDVDKFYVYKLYLNGDVKIINKFHKNNGVIIEAEEVYNKHKINYTFYSNMGTCKTYKNK